MNKPSFGNGYGINRKTGGASSLSTAVPPYGRVTITPGTGRGRAHIGKAKIYPNKPK